MIQVKLPTKFVEFLTSMPESGMGYQKVNVAFSDGSQYNCVVSNSEEIQLPDSYKEKTISKISFNKHNPTELISQLVKVLSEKPKSEKLEKVIDEIKSLSKEVFQEFQKDRVQIAMKKKALYWSDKTNVFRPNKGELNEKLFKCPKCRNTLARIKNKNQEQVFFCANCKYEIQEKNLLHDRNKIQEFKELKKQKIISCLVNELFEKTS